MGFSSSRHTYANGHCDSDGYLYCHSYGNCGANRFFATEQSDRNSDRDGYPDSYGNDDIHCTLEARLVGFDAVIVKDHAGSAHQAIEGAVRKLKRAVGTEIAKHDPRGHRTPPDEPRAVEPVGIPD